MSQSDRERERRDPFEGLGNSGEPVEDLGLTLTTTVPTPAVLTKKPRGERKTPIRPSEKRRRPRQVTVTFSTVDIPHRLRELALQWGMTGPDNRSPNISGLIEYLLLSQLEAAEEGKIDSPNGTK